VMGRFVLEDLEGSLSVTLFADQLQRFEPLLTDEATVLVRGQVRERGSDQELTAEEIVPLDRAADKLVTAVRVNLQRELSRGELLRLRDVVTEHPGDFPLELAIRLDSTSVRVCPESRFKVSFSPAMIAAVEQLTGADTVSRQGL